jgi:hypothetical protein
MANPSYESGDTMINVYRSNFAGTNKATAMTWEVDDVDDAVRTLKAKGVEIEATAHRCLVIDSIPFSNAPSQESDPE